MRVRAWMVIAIVILAGWRGSSASESDAERMRALPGTQAGYHWMHWWELNRDVYLRKALNRRAAAATQGVTYTDALKKASAALLEASKSADGDLRAEAILALARMGEGKDRALVLTKDEDVRVRCRARVALGLLDEEEKLLEQQDLSQGEAMATIAALGLLDHAGDNTLARLRASAHQSKSWEVHRLSIWALRVQIKHKADDAHRDEDRGLMLEVLRTTPFPPVGAEAITALAVVGDGRDIPALVEIVACTAAARNLPAQARKGSTVKSPKGPLFFPACLALAELAKREGKPADPSGGVNQDSVRAQNVLTRFFENSYGMNSFALIEYGAADFVGEFLNSDSGWDEKRKRHVYDMHRANAAMALGACAGGGGRPIEAAGADSSLPQQIREKLPRVDVPNAMKIRASLSSEPRFLRAACALALGMSGSRTSGDDLAYVARQIKPRNQPVLWGHIVLALGLLGDERALDGAKALLGPGAKQIDVDKILKLQFDDRVYLKPNPASPFEMEDVLAARAAVVGLAALGDRRCAPVLLGQWGTNQYVSLEAARALGWCEAYEASDSFIALLAQDEKRKVAAWAARSLGEMLDRNRPSRLGRLVEGDLYPYWGSTYSWLAIRQVPPPWNGPDLIDPEFVSLGNPFLYWAFVDLGYRPQ